ncbi:MAG: Gfo/Idh/MocA family oxidoreductase [Clostridiales bacterium]|nr:Gfo/Idh/MocA family oxidoreductase [Clostridiales bacterium]
MNKIRTAVVGLGFIGARHIDAIRRIGNAEIAAVADLNPNAVKKFSGDFGIAGYTDYTELLENERIDVLHNCTPNSLHFEVNKAAIVKGVNIYSEKPLAATIEQGEELVRLANECKAANAVNFNYRANPAVMEMRERVQNGAAGRCYLIHGSYMQDWLSEETDYDWRVAESGNGPRALADIGSHWFDLAQFVYGKRIASVCAAPFIAHNTRQKPDGERVAVENDDGASVLIRFEDGLTANLVVSQVSAGYKNSVSISVDCQNYSMRWQQQDADKLVIGKRDGGEERVYAASQYFHGEAKRWAFLPNGHAAGWSEALFNAIAMYYENVFMKTAHPACASFSDALEVMRVVSACAASGKEKRFVDIY